MAHCPTAVPRPRRTRRISSPLRTTAPTATSTFEGMVHHDGPGDEPALLEEVLGRPVPGRGKGAHPAPALPAAEGHQPLEHGLPPPPRPGLGVDEQLGHDPEPAA